MVAMFLEIKGRDVTFMFSMAATAPTVLQGESWC